jgi:FdhE protein
MLWPLAQRRHVTDSRFAERVAAVRRENPESERWLALVEAAVAEAGSGEAWGDALLTIAADQPARAPILHGARIAVRRRVLHRWVHDLLALAELAIARGSLEPAALVEAAVSQDDGRLDSLAGLVRLEAPALRVAAQIIALPLLQTCGRALAMQIPPATSWQEGYCPVCGAWPTLAEFRGLERKRWLRCGRCATGWEVPWLRCPFCNETEHTNLGYLAPEDGESTRKVEVCDTCKGYVKAEPTVRSLAPSDILLDDLATVPLEVAALDRGYHRPARPGYVLQVQVVET